ncbi:hypothetical protein OH768_37205 [Streptomyces sp. NBC_01622]|nr:hypothetical protein OH768_37205 [Streptomyces sp. NBC_01622]
MGRGPARSRGGSRSAGFRAAPHVEQNAGAIAKGPLTAGQLAGVDQVLGR